MIEKEAGPRRSRSGTFWLIVRNDGGNGNGPLEVLTLGPEGEVKTLPVFGFEDEALLYLRLGSLEGRWRAGETDAADLASALAGAYRGIQRIVLDPFPEVGFDGFYEAVSVRRERFVDLLLT